MQITDIKSCYIGPAISPEQFIAEHFFLYLVQGSITGYDGHKRYTLKPGEYCIARKNHLARYSKQKDNGEFGKIVIVFDKIFLKAFKEKYSIAASVPTYRGAFIGPEKNELVGNYIQSLAPYYEGGGKLNETFANVKREELLLILLKTDQHLADILFDFGIPGKIDLEVFMNKNYKFNVGIERFAYLTGRSLSAFKRDFEKTFSETPGRWLLKRRLQEAYFLIEKKSGKAADIYLDLGFEDLSHFSFAFKKEFGYTPGEVGAAKL